MSADSPKSTKDEILDRPENKLDEGETEVDDVEFNYDVERVVTKNILVVGDSRAGKTSFINTILDSNHSSELEIYRGTVNPESQELLLLTDEGHYNLRFIDTPGLNEITKSGNKRSNVIIKNLISSFVKRDVTQLHMVLIVVNAASGVNQGQISSIEEIIDFLGIEMTKNTAILVTHFENKTKKDELEWLKQFQMSEELEVLSDICKAGILFSGVMEKSSYEDVSYRDMMAIKQTKRIMRFLRKVTRSEPIKLGVKANESVKSFLSIQENNNSLIENISNLIKEVEEVRSKAIKTRLEISTSKHSVSEDVKLVVQEAGFLDDKTLSFNFDQQLKIRSEQQQKDADFLERLQSELMSANDRVTEIFNKLKKESRRLKYK